MVLAFLGTEGHQTAFHVDWTSAENVAWALEGVPSDAILALWYFVPPCKLDEFEYRVAHKGWLSNLSQGLRCGTAKMPKLTIKQWEEIRGEMGINPETPTHWVEKIEQRHGDWIGFCAGWGHAVLTLQPSLKLAWDNYDIDSFPSYVTVWRDVITEYTAHKAVPADYAGIMVLVWRAEDLHVP